MAGSNAESMKAPEEIFKPAAKKGDLKAETELSREERRRRRADKKRQVTTRFSFVLSSFFQVCYAITLLGMRTIYLVTRCQARTYMPKYIHAPFLSIELLPPRRLPHQNPPNASLTLLLSPLLPSSPLRASKADKSRKEEAKKARAVAQGGEAPILGRKSAEAQLAAQKGKKGKKAAAIVPSHKSDFSKSGSAFQKIQEAQDQVRYCKNV